jgi:hypothetical protein
MKKLFAAALLVAGSLVTYSAAQAHHSFSAEFDREKPIKFDGVVTRVEWSNPHVWIYVNVKDESGKVTNYGAELGPPHGLQRSGWRRETLKIGDKVSVDGWMAKNGSNRVNARTITLAGTGARPGTTLDAVSSGTSKDGR